MQTTKKTIVDYREMAKAYMDKHKCRWSEACLAVKRHSPEARAVFGAPQKITA